MSDVQPIRRAILAPYDKTGLVAFAAALVQRDVGTGRLGRHRLACWARPASP
jgi:hypothetical protein